MDLEDWSTRLKVFADATRVRLLTLLEQEELTVAELSAITTLAQSVSGMKPIRTSSFSGLSEPAAQTPPWPSVAKKVAPAVAAVLFFRNSRREAPAAAWGSSVVMDDSWRNEKPGPKTTTASIT